MSVKTSQNPSNYSSSQTVTLPSLPSSTITVNPVGSSGQYLNSSGSAALWGTTTITSPTISIKAHDNGDAIIETHHHKINLDAFYSQVCEMLCILPEDKKLHEEYPTLKDAYDNYKDKMPTIKIDNDVRDAYNTYQSLKAILTIKEK